MAMSLLGPVSRMSLLPSRAYQECTCLRLFHSSPSRSNESATNGLSDLLQSYRNENQARNATQSRQRSQTVLAPRPNRSSFGKAGFDMISKTARDVGAARQKKESSPEALASLQAAQDRSDLEKQLTRRWRSGDVYAPHDISGVEMSKWRQSQRKGRPKKDVFDILKINPLDHYKNFALMSEYMTEMGRIKHSNETGLRPVNQRKVAKAVRRAIGLGLMPSVHRHPEILSRRS